jgi:hypothetical protein
MKRKTPMKPTPVVAWMPQQENRGMAPLYAEADVVNMMGHQHHTDDNGMTEQEGDGDSTYCGPAEAAQATGATAKSAVSPRQRSAAEAEASSDSGLGSQQQNNSTHFVIHIQFRRKFTLLSEYKYEFGAFNVSKKNCSVAGKFKGLYRFVQFWRTKAKNFEKDPSAKKPPSDKAKVLLLLALGVDLETHQTRATSAASGAEVAAKRTR